MYPRLALCSPSPYADDGTEWTSFVHLRINRTLKRKPQVHVDDNTHQGFERQHGNSFLAIAECGPISALTPFLAHVICGRTDC
jgi:hypothetical protein